MKLFLLFVFFILIVCVLPCEDLSEIAISYEELIKKDVLMYDRFGQIETNPNMSKIPHEIFFLNGYLNRYQILRFSGDTVFVHFGLWHAASCSQDKTMIADMLSSDFRRFNNIFKFWNEFQIDVNTTLKSTFISNKDVRKLIKNYGLLAIVWGMLVDELQKKFDKNNTLKKVK